MSQASHSGCLCSGSPSQSPGPQGPLGDYPSYLSMMIATNMKCILCARHMNLVGPQNNLKVTAIIIPASGCGG